MKNPKSNKVLEAVDKLEADVGASLSTSGSSLETTLQKTNKKVPRTIKKSAAELQSLKDKSRYQPYILKHQEVACDRAVKKIAEFSEADLKPTSKAGGAKQWIARLTLNYLLFLLALFAFWYIGTQL